jgi:plasmid stabilization system protein ParE
MSRYLLLGKVRDDLRAIQRYYLDEGSPEAARTVLISLRKAFQSLAKRPLQGHRREDLTDKPLRFWTVGPYMIAYRPESQPLEIVAVLHGRRHVARLLRHRQESSP